MTKPFKSLTSSTSAIADEIAAERAGLTDAQEAPQDALLDDDDSVFALRSSRGRHGRS